MTSLAPVERNRMSRLYLRLLILPLLIFTATLLLIRAQPYDDHDLRQLLLPEGCPAPCFMGIRPGVTTVVEMIEFLEASDWVENVQNDTRGNSWGNISWKWSSRKPDWITQNAQGQIFAQNNLVMSLTVSTKLSLGAVLLTLGIPDMEKVDPHAEQQRELSLYWAEYGQRGLTIKSWQPCHVMEPLRSTVIITLSQPSSIHSTHVNTLSDVFDACSK
jgi:hypothetical protein